MYASHFFFSSSSQSSLLSRLSDRSHPPLSKRISKIDPAFDGEFPYIPGYYKAADGPVDKLDWLPKMGATEHHNTPGIAAQLVNPDEIIESIGVPENKHFLYITRLMASIPSLSLIHI